MLVVLQISRTVIVDPRLFFHQVEVLLQLHPHLLCFQPVLGHDIRQSFVVSVLLFRLLSLGPVGHADVAVVLDLLLEFGAHLFHVLQLLVDAVAQFFAILLGSHVVFLPVNVNIRVT